MDRLHPFRLASAGPPDRTSVDGGHRTLTRALRDPVVASAAIWAVILTAMFVTYTRLAPAEYLHLTHRGVVGALSRMVMEINFPISLIAIV